MRAGVSGGDGEVRARELGNPEGRDYAVLCAMEKLEETHRLSKGAKTYMEKAGRRKKTSLEQ